MSLQILGCLNTKDFPNHFLTQETHWLSYDEQQDLHNTLTPALTTRLLGRFALRYLLNHHTGWSPEQLNITLTPKGKPLLEGTPFHFSISHSGDWIIIAICENHAIGVDYEHQRAVSNSLKIAKRFFATTEVLELESYTPETQAHCFNQIWSAKEAILKATGEGIATLLNQVVISPQQTCFAFQEERFKSYHLTGCYWDNGWLHLFSQQPFTTFEFMKITAKLEIQKITPTVVKDYNRSAHL